MYDEPRVQATCESCGWDDPDGVPMLAFSIGKALCRCRLCQTLFWHPASFPGSDLFEAKWF